MNAVIDDILNKVSGVSGVPVDDILGDSRVSDTVCARHVAVYHCIRKGISTMSVANVFGLSRYSVNRIVSTYWSRRTEWFYLLDDAISKST